MLEQIKGSLNALGITPFWQDHFMAVALQPLLKRDIRAAYTSGALTDDKLEPALRQTGHTDDAVETLKYELKAARRTALHSHIAIRNWVEQQIDGTDCQNQLSSDGFDTDTIALVMLDVEYEFGRSSWAEAFVKGLLPRQAFLDALTGHGVTDSGATALADKLSYRIVDHQSARNFIAGAIDRASAKQSMVLDGVASDAADKLLDDANSQLTNMFLTECTRGVRERYRVGEIDQSEALDALKGHGVDPAWAQSLIGYFDCGKRADGTRIAEEKLCHWLYIGTITPDYFLRSLHKLGYTDENASLLLQDCIQSNTLRAIKEAKQVAKEYASEQNRILAATKKAAALVDRQNQRLFEARKKAAKVREGRDKQIISAAERLYKLTSEGLSAAIDAVRMS